MKLIGATPENGRKLLLTVAFVPVACGRRGLGAARASSPIGGLAKPPVSFWARQTIKSWACCSCWSACCRSGSTIPTRLATALGLVTAGLAFALQRVVTAFAGYFVILRGKTFNVGDRIVMGGVRGDVVALGFIQTTIMEMGQPPPVQSGRPGDVGAQPPVHRPHRHRHQRQDLRRAGLQLHARVPLHLGGDARCRSPTPPTAAGRADPAGGRRRHTVTRRASSARTDSRSCGGATSSTGGELRPRVYYRLTDNWLELTVRFVGPDHGIRELKDAMSREILDAFDEAGDRRSPRRPSRSSGCRR